jgi:hypothetical protein
MARIFAAGDTFAKYDFFASSRARVLSQRAGA